MDSLLAWLVLIVAVFSTTLFVVYAVARLVTL